MSSPARRGEAERFLLGAIGRERAHDAVRALVKCMSEAAAAGTSPKATRSARKAISALDILCSHLNGYCGWGNPAGGRAPTALSSAVYDCATRIRTKLVESHRDISGVGAGRPAAHMELIAELIDVFGSPEPVGGGSSKPKREPRRPKPDEPWDFGYRDISKPSEFEGSLKFESDWDWWDFAKYVRSYAYGEDGAISVNAHPQLVRALTASKRARRVRHPDGEDFAMDSICDLGAKVPGTDSWDRLVNKPTIPHLVVLVDCSGSMGHGFGRYTPRAYANAAATMIARSAIAARCPFDIVPYEEDPHFSIAKSWRPGQPEPVLPVEFKAGGNNDLMGSTIQAAHHIFSKLPRRGTRRIVISICDGDLQATYYDRSKPGHKPSAAALMACPGGDGFMAAIADMKDLPVLLGAEAHCLAIGFQKGHWENALRSEGHAMTMNAFKSCRPVPNFDDLPEAMSALAADLLAPVKAGVA